MSGMRRRSGAGKLSMRCTSDAANDCAKRIGGLPVAMDSRTVYIGEVFGLWFVVYLYQIRLITYGITQTEVCGYNLKNKECSRKL